MGGWAGRLTTVAHEKGKNLRVDSNRRVITVINHVIDYDNGIATILQTRATVSPVSFLFFLGWQQQFTARL